MNNTIHHIGPANTQIGIDVDAIAQESSPKKGRSHHVLVRIEGVSKAFKTPGSSVVIALNEIDLHLYAGEFVMVYGPSGCGKSTLLHTILGLEQPTRGTVSIRDQDIYALDTDTRAHLRRHMYGMVFQQSHWIKAFNVWENISYPLLLAGYSRSDLKENALAILDRLNVAHLANRSPIELSGGQQQKIALARALSTNPGIIIADEPTGNLDSTSGREIMQLLVKLNRDERRMVILVTHDLTLLPLATRRVGLKDGKILFDEHDT